MWMPGAIGGAVKFQHRLSSPASHAGQIGDTPRGTHDSHGFSTTRSPISHALGFGAERDHFGDDFVPEHLRHRREVAHGVVHVHLAEVHEHLLGVRPADAREQRLRDDPVGEEEVGVGHVDEVHRRARERGDERVVGVGLRDLRRLDSVEQCAHVGAPS